jgi:transposase
MDLPLDLPQPKEVLADAGYDSDDNRGSLMIRATKPVIKPNPTRKTMPDFDREAYKNRNKIERMFSKLKHMRRIATRYDKTRCSFAAFINLAAIRIWLPSFVHRT